MRKALNILFIVLLMKTTYASKNDSLLKKGFNINPVLFIEYPGLAASPGFDCSFYLKKRYLYGDIGTLGGSAYPFLPNLNYYIGGGIDFFGGQRRYEFLGKTKFMYSHSNSAPSEHEQFSTLLGLSYSYRLKNLIVGIESYAWWTSFTHTHSEYKPVYLWTADPNQSETSYSYKGFLGTQVVSLRVAYQF
jgi:hypothetical protein